MPLVPAAISGTDRISRLAPLRVAYGTPIELDDLAQLPRRRRRRCRDGSAARGDPLARGVAELSGRPLLVVDGDSFAHRAFHALPRSIRRADGRPGQHAHRAHVDAAASVAGRAAAGGRRRLGHGRRPDLPHRRAARLSGRSRVRPRDPRAARPATRAARVHGHRVREGGRATRRTTSSPPPSQQEEGRGGETLVATSDRDAFQLASPATTILQPTRGVSEMVRVGPAEVRERYGVEPAQVVDFIALRGDPSDRIPGARGVGAKTAASLLNEHGTLDALLAAGRFAAEADALRTLPADRDARRIRAVARARRSRAGLGRGRGGGTRARSRASRRATRRGGAGRGLMELVGDALLARLHPTSQLSHAESEQRLDGDPARARARARRARGDQGGAASACTTRRTSTRSRRSTRRPGSTATRPSARRRSKRRGSQQDARSPRSSWRGSRSCAHPGITRCRIAPWASASSGTSSSRRVTPRRCSVIERVAIVDWDVHHGNGTEACVDGDDSVLFVSLHQWPFYPGTGGPGSGDETTVNIPLPAGSGDVEYLAAFTELVEPAVRRFEPGLLLVSAGFDAHVEDPLGQMRVTADGFREMARRCAAPRAARRRGAGRRLQPSHAPVARRRREGRVRGCVAPASRCRSRA